MLGEVAAGDEAAHGVGEDEVGEARPQLAAGQLAHAVDVCDEGVEPAFHGHVAQEGGVRAAAAVADVVVAAHGKAVLGKEASELVVALDVLAHAVDELHDAARLGGGQPEMPRDGGAPVGAGEADVAAGDVHGAAFLLSSLYRE